MKSLVILMIVVFAGLSPVYAQSDDPPEEIISCAFGDSLCGIKKDMQSLRNWITGACQSNTDLCNKIYSPLNEIWTPFWGSVTKTRSEVEDGLGGITNSIGGVLEDIVVLVRGLADYLPIGINSGLGILTAILDWIPYAIRWAGDLLQAVWSFITELVESVIELLTLVLRLLEIILTEWNNATPLPPPGLEDCAVNPSEKDLCLILWAMQETVFEGSRGEAIKNLMSGIVAMVIGSLIIFKFREIVITTNRATS